MASGSQAPEGFALEAPSAPPSQLSQPSSARVKVKAPKRPAPDGSASTASEGASSASRPVSHDQPSQPTAWDFGRPITACSENPHHPPIGAHPYQRRPPSPAGKDQGKGKGAPGNFSYADIASKGKKDHLPSLYKGLLDLMLHATRSDHIMRELPALAVILAPAALLLPYSHPTSGFAPSCWLPVTQLVIPALLVPVISLPLFLPFSLFSSSSSSSFSARRPVAMGIQSDLRCLVCNGDPK